MTTIAPEFAGQERTEHIVHDFLDDYSFDHVYVLDSGGHDSDTTLQVAHNLSNLPVDGVVHINTGVGIPATRDYVKMRCSQLDLPYHELTSWRHHKQDTDFPDLEQHYHGYRRPEEEYSHLIQKYGFPGPPVHHRMYQNLKEKPLQRFLSDHDGDVALISGVRKAESERRKVNISETGIQEKLGAVWVSPLLAWTKKDIRKYRNEQGIPDNPVVKEMHMSGECLCGAYADREEMTMLKLFYPNVARHLEWLEHDVYEEALKGNVDRRYSLWGHGSLSQQEYDARTNNEQATLTMCSDCEERCGDQPYEMDGEPLSHVEAYMKSGWTEEQQQRHTVYCPACDVVTDQPLLHREVVHTVDGSVKLWDPRLVEQNNESIVTTGDPNVDIVGSCDHDWDESPEIDECIECGAFRLTMEGSFDDLVVSGDEGNPQCPRTQSTPVTVDSPDGQHGLDQFTQ